MQYTPFFETPNGRLYRGDCLRILQEIPSGSIDAVITDPPYSSGGFTRSDKALSAVDKYQQSGTKRIYPNFGGDNRDSRGWLAWCALWIWECWRVLREGGYFLMFSDWRQLPVATDAMQAGGIFWRGLIVWDKGYGSRAPNRSYFRHQCEYIPWGSKGKLPIRGDNGPFPGCFHFPVLQSDKFHLTGKPTHLMKALVSAMPKESVILDPFAGSGTTCVAAASSGYSYIGIEAEESYCAITEKRLRELRKQGAFNFEE